MSSCCGGNCGCGANCKCGKGCSGCKMYPDLTENDTAASRTMVLGVAPQKGDFDAEEFEVAAGAENRGCMCGSNWTCDPCSCN